LRIEKVLKKYPNILTEDVTIDLAQRVSIARFGDGEWRCAVENGCTSQRADPALARELQNILLNPVKACLVCLPNVFLSPRRESWLRYADERYTQYCGGKTYGSAFISRPDNAPWIDRPDYWEKVRDLWRGRDVVLVIGDRKSITTEMIDREAASVVEVHGPSKHAYASIDELMGDIHLASAERTDVLHVLCLGATATVIAYRLALEGYHALDLGHIGMFMKHAGAYRYTADDLSTFPYRLQLAALHRKRSWGADGAKHVEAVQDLVAQFEPASILDYGCGEGKLAAALAPLRVTGYDPGMEEYSKLPKPADLVICTDVLEHVEPEKLNAVLDHLWRLTGTAAYFVISTKLANAVLPDGRNAHLTVQPADWWSTKLRRIGWHVAREAFTGKDLHVWLEKP
jgi:SAM-dependent methyltransferase